MIRKYWKGLKLSIKTIDPMFDLTSFTFINAFLLQFYIFLINDLVKRLYSIPDTSSASEGTEMGKNI
jgi:hypothetical protein